MRPQRTRHSTWKASGSLKLLLCAFGLIAIVLPLYYLLSSMATVDVFSVVSGRKFIRALQHSLCASLTATGVSVLIAGIISWCVVRTKIRHKALLMTLLSLPMLIPSISHGMGLVIVLGARGWISRALGLSGGIYGFWGIVAGSVMYSFPVAFLMLCDILAYEDGTPYEAAEVMGLSFPSRLFAITLPYLWKPLISVVFAVFTMIITDYGVPLMVGGKYITLPVMLYQDVIGMLDFGKGSVIGAVLLLPALIACVFDMASKERGSENSGTSFRIRSNAARDRAARAVCLAFLTIVFLPIASFAVLAFVTRYPIDMTISLKNVWQTLDMGMLRYLKNSIVIALVVSILGTVLATVNAYMTVRLRTKLSGALHLMSVLTLAVPGLVLGLSYILFFKGMPIYGTLAMMFLVNTVHFFASPYLMMYNTFGKIDMNLEDVGEAMGVSRWRIFRDVLIPQSAGTIIEMMSYFFINSMMTISAVSFLATVANKPVALMITQFEGQMQLECAAFVSLVILAVNVGMKWGLYSVKKALA